MKSPQDILFPPFRFSPVAGRLWQEGKAVALRPKALAVLRYLIEQRGRVVSKKELLHAVWADVKVSDAVLKVVIRQLRVALRDEATTPRFIATVGREGYRFIAPLTFYPQPVESLKSQVQSSFPAPGTQHPAPRLVGREAELTQLHEWLAKARIGQRQLVFITGEPGIGKTTLVDAFVAQVATMPEVWIARGQCIEQYGSGEAYRPVLEGLERLCQGPNHDLLLPFLRQYAPLWLVQMLALVPPEEREELRRELVGSTRERMLREFSSFVESLTAEGRVHDSPLLVLILEDLHWSDSSTAELLASLARRREAARLMVIGTYRPGEMLTTEHPLTGVIQELEAHGLCTELPVEGLSSMAVEEYLRERFAEETRATSPLQEVARMLHQQTQGHPLFLVNLVNDWVSQGLLVEESGSWVLRSDCAAKSVEVPRNIRQLLAKQMARLSAEDRRVLVAASVAGVEFSTATVVAALAVDSVEVETRCEDLARRQQFLQPAGICQWPDGTLAAQYRFRHAVYQHLWHERGTVGQCQQWHRRMGERLEAAYGERAGDIAAELAVHFEQGRDYRRAVQYLGQAADNALRRYAPQEVLRCLTTALELLKMLPDTRERTRQEVDLYAALGAILMATRGYAAPEVGQAYTRAHELCLQINRPSQQLFHILWGLFISRLMQVEIDSAYALGEELATLAESLEYPALRAEAYLALGATEFHQGKFVQAREHLECGATLPPPQPLDAHLINFGQDPWVTCLCYEAFALALLGYLEQAQQKLQLARSRAQMLAHPFSLVFYQEFFCHVARLRREPQSVYEYAQHALTVSTEYGFPHLLAIGQICRGWSLSEQQIEEGAMQIRQGLAAYQAVGASLARPYFLAFLAEALSRTQQVGEGLAAVTEGLELTQRTGERYCEAELYRLKGTLTLQKEARGWGLAPPLTSPKSQVSGEVEREAEGCFLKAIEIARQQSAKLFELRAMMNLSRLWVRQGKRQEARQMLAEIYGWFTEGFDTADLKEARVLLEELDGAAKIASNKKHKM